MRIELVQLPGQDCNIKANLDAVMAAIQQRSEQTDLLVFPETYLTGFPTKDNIGSLAHSLESESFAPLRTACREENIAIAIGTSELSDGKFYNTTSLITPSGIAMRYRKTHLWASDKGIFTPGNQLMTCEWQGIRVGILICYDIEFPETARALASLGADLLIVTNGNMDPYGPVHRNAIIARAMENQMFAVMVNRCGAGDDLMFAGGSCVVNPFGDVVVECGRDPIQVAVDIDLNLIAQSRETYRYLSDRRLSLQGEIIETPDGIRALQF